MLNYNAQGSYTYDDNVSCIPQKNGDLLNHIAIEADFASSRYQIWTRRYVYRKNTKMFVKGGRGENEVIISETPRRWNDSEKCSLQPNLTKPVDLFLRESGD